ncbi:MAG: RNA methyltransferase [Bacilli bacterium]|nr:RNA methyltransferase [Bacilli bacterium]
MVITSLTNQEVKYLDKLKQRKYRELEKKFLVEGEHLVEEAIKKSVLDKIIVLENSNFNFDYPKVEVTEEVMKKISSLDTPPNIIGLCNMLQEDEIGSKVLILDTIQDPGNLGTIIRSAVAFNVDTIILSENTVDLYNPKVIRSTQGMIFHINIVRRNLIEEINNLKTRNIPIYTTNVESGEDIKNVKDISKYALIVGNEGNGVRNDIATLADHNIYISMNSKVESLNVGVATSILLYELGGKDE